MDEVKPLTAKEIQHLEWLVQPEDGSPVDKVLFSAGQLARLLGEVRQYRAVQPLQDQTISHLCANLEGKEKCLLAAETEILTLRAELKDQSKGQAGEGEFADVQAALIDRATRVPPPTALLCSKAADAIAHLRAELEDTRVAFRDVNREAVTFLDRATEIEGQLHREEALAEMAELRAARAEADRDRLAQTVREQCNRAELAEAELEQVKRRLARIWAL